MGVANELTASIRDRFNGTLQAVVALWLLTAVSQAGAFGQTSKGVLAGTILDAAGSAIYQVHRLGLKMSKGPKEERLRAALMGSTESMPLHRALTLLW